MVKRERELGVWSGQHFQNAIAIIDNHQAVHRFNFYLTSLLLLVFSLLGLSLLYGLFDENDFQIRVFGWRDREKWFLIGKC